MATKSLRTSDERWLAWLQETFGEGVWDWDVETGAIEFGAGFLAGLGFDPVAVHRDVDFWVGLIHPDDVERVRKGYESHLEGRTGCVQTEYRVRAASGEWRWIHDRAKVVERTPEGAPTRVLVISTDISAARRADAEHRETGQVVAALFDNAPVGIVTLGADRLVQSWNKAAEGIFGWLASEVVGRPQPVIAPEEGEDFDRRWDEMLAGTSLVMERRASRKDGAGVDVRLSAVPLFGPDGRLTQVLCLLEDISEQKRLAAQFLQAQRLENTSRLAGAVAHDFNNLLTVINGYSEIVLGALDARDPLLESMREIKLAGDRAAALTQQLLAFSRRQVMQPNVLSVNDVLTDLESMLRRLIGEDIHLVLARDSRAGHVKADPVQVQQVIMNLAVNARDAMPHGGRLQIETSNVELGPDDLRAHPGAAPGAYVLLSVTDNGMGMDEATLGRLFEPFFTTKEKGKGTGLGLSTVYGIVRQSGGYVWAESERGRGTIFRVYLPRVDDATGERPADDRQETTGTETVLLVEDQPEVRQLALHALGLYGYRVLSAANGAEALAIARQEASRIDLVLTDVVMPGMNGPDLARAIEPIRPGIPVLLMSGYSDEAAAPGGIPDTLAYIQKPFTPESLARKVRQVLDTRSASGRILVVDDEAEIRKLLRQFLEQAGYRVTEASNGRQAVAEVDAGGVALVITDLVMPEKEGIETIREMRQRHRDVKIIAMSGAFGGRFLHTAEMLGAHATLNKPVRAEQLVSAVRRVLRGLP